MSYLDELFGMGGKRVLVTGGSRGIGAAIAEGFLRAGATVYVSSRDPAKCDAAAAELSTHGDCISLPANVSEDASRDALVAELRRREERLDVLVNNAGAIWAAPLDEYPASGWDKVYDLNVRATFFLIQALIPLLEAAGTAASPARIINVGSANALRIPTFETYAYVSSKAALHQLTRHLAGQIASRNVTANVLAPGRFGSAMQTAELERKGADGVTAAIPLGRLADVDDVAAAALYLASRAGSYLTGAVIPVDGGMATTV